ncbi:Methyl-accepting chemotaxis protein I (serine chemoreceptor protein) [Cronobacter sakazakii 696]|nr:Methyl-accepting chemotaxis protein I (serine chemoreceptor protein) [Cronobacter sakazakii 696]
MAAFKVSRGVVSTPARTGAAPLARVEPVKPALAAPVGGDNWETF